MGNWTWEAFRQAMSDPSIKFIAEAPVEFIRRHADEKLEKVQGEAFAMSEEVTLLARERDVALLQISAKDEELAAFREALANLISLTDGATNYTVLEDAQLDAARILLSPESRFRDKRHDECAHDWKIETTVQAIPGEKVTMDSFTVCQKCRLVKGR